MDYLSVPESGEYIDDICLILKEGNLDVQNIIID